MRGRVHRSWRRAAGGSAGGGLLRPAADGPGPGRRRAPHRPGARAVCCGARGEPGRGATWLRGAGRSRPGPRWDRRGWQVALELWARRKPCGAGAGLPPARGRAAPTCSRSRGDIPRQHLQLALTQSGETAAVAGGLAGAALCPVPSSRGAFSSCRRGGRARGVGAWSVSALEPAGPAALAPPGHPQPGLGAVCGARPAPRGAEPELPVQPPPFLKSLAGARSAPKRPPRASARARHLDPQPARAGAGAERPDPAPPSACSHASRRPGSR